MQPQPLIALSDVESGSLWFQHVLNLSSGHGGHEYEMLMDGDTMVAQLHDWDADEHATWATRRSRRGEMAFCCGSTTDAPAKESDRRSVMRWLAR